MRTANRDSWNKYISNVEQSLNGRQNFTYKVMKHLSEEETDSLNIHAVTTED